MPGRIPDKFIDALLARIDKVNCRALEDGTPAHRFATWMANLSSLVRNTCRTPSASANAPSFDIETPPDPTRHRALELIKSIHL
ncbi:MAG: hypothetical protein LBQ20_01135 [Rhodanobacter sp.]|jgi:hypothetical protein|nr:hypothetical protein [Rhodanobacter sp.]